jgi:DnaJ-class molecular chaperone
MDECDAFCRNYRPYAQAAKTMTFGCANCGKPPQSHSNYCHECVGTGKGPNEKNEPDDMVSCTMCNGSGRADGVFWSGV